jgi:hypothetical protein
MTTNIVQNPFPIERVLAQINPSGTSAVTAYTKPTNKIVTVNTIVVCNTSGSAINFSLYLCTNGTTYNTTTALAYQQPIAANETQVVYIPFTLDTTSGTVGVQSSSANAINFTILGNVKEHN